MHTRSQVPRPTARSLAPWLVLVALTALGLALMLRGYTFYALDVAARAEHADYRTLSPSGLIGHGYGMLGTLLMLTNLLYLLRRQFPTLPVGSMRLWLDIHVLTGLAGALFVTFHSAFQLRTKLASASMVSVLLVVVTGLVGRYLVARIPSGNVPRLVASLGRLEALAPGARHVVDRALATHVITDPVQSLSLFAALALAPTWLREGRARGAIVRDALATDDATGVERAGASEPAAYEAAIEDVVREATRQPHAVAARAILAPWRRLHRFFAFVFVVSVTVHIGVAWHYGFRWVFSE